MYPELQINLPKLKSNLEYLCTLCHKNGLTVGIVTKVFCADPNITALIENSEADFLMDSRIENLQKYNTKKPKVLLRISSPSDVERVVRYADISLQSETFTIKKLGEAAKKADKKHKVVLMIDLGDLREGIFFENEAEIFTVAEAVISEPNLELYGIGTNLTCYGGVLPDSKNLSVLSDIADKLRKKYKVELPMVSGGNSSTIEFLKSGGVPSGITNLRLGESFVLGNDTAICKVSEGLFGDAITLNAELVEIKNKPSKPIGTIGKNAFGEVVEIEDKGNMLRGILAIGRQDIPETGITPANNIQDISIIGASSDHLLVDLTRNSVYNVGDVLAFTLDYGAVLRSFTSPYVSKKYISF